MTLPNKYFKKMVVALCCSLSLSAFALSTDQIKFSNENSKYNPTEFIAFKGNSQRLPAGKTVKSYRTYAIQFKNLPLTLFVKDYSTQAIKRKIYTADFLKDANRPMPTILKVKRGTKRFTFLVGYKVKSFNPKTRGAALTLFDVKNQLLPGDIITFFEVINKNKTPIEQCTNYTQCCYDRECNGF